MSWIYGWLLLGGLALILAAAALARAALGKRRGWLVLPTASLTCGVLALLCALQLVNGYVQDWLASSLLDVVPTLALASTLAACAGLVLNLLAIWLHMRDKACGAGKT